MKLINKLNEYAIKDPYRGTGIYVILALILTSALPTFLPSLMNITDNQYIWIGLLAVVLSLFTMFLYRRINHNQYDSFIRYKIIPTIILSLPFIGYLALAFITQKFETVTMYMIGLSLVNGFTEETVMRGILISQYLKVSLNKKHFYYLLIISSLIFSFIHLTWLFNGAALIDIINQFYFTLCMGLIFGAIVIRTGNIFIGIILHTINNILAYSCITDNYPILLNIYLLLMAIYGLYIIRPAKSDEIIKLWNQKWQKEN